MSRVIIYFVLMNAEPLRSLEDACINIRGKRLGHRILLEDNDICISERFGGHGKLREDCR
jgi:hypothetical protein